MKVIVKNDKFTFCFEFVFFIAKSIHKTIAFVINFFLIFSLAGCISLNTKNRFLPHEDWLALPVDHKPVNEIRVQLEQFSKTTLKDRGEAHITVLTPPEFAKLKSKLSMSEINKLATELNLTESRWTPICIAEARLQSDPKLVTYYIVVRSQELLTIRQNIMKEFLARGGESSQFDPNHFYPHITIGYTERDLHEQDGVIKNTQNCIYELTSFDGKPLKKMKLINQD